MKPMEPQQFQNFAKKRLPSRERIEDIRALGMLHDDKWLEDFAETLLDLRQAAHGGRRDIRSGHWNMEEQ